MEAQASETGRKERVLLLVDDEPHVLSALTRALRRDGYRILRAGGGAEGLARLEAEPAVGVIVSDQRMPGMSGVEFLRRAKALRPDTVRIVLSGYTDLETVTDAINEGAIFKFLTKPWDDELLRRNIAEAFRYRELQLENERLARELAAANRELSREVEEKSRQSACSLQGMEVLQGVLDALPLPVLAVDTEGVVVLANRRAEALLASGKGPVVGLEADEVLPPELSVHVGADGYRGVVELRGVAFGVCSQPLGERDQPRGWVLACLPVVTDGGAPRVGIPAGERMR